MTKKIKILKDFTYFALVKEALFNTPGLKATARDIFGYVVGKYPTVFRNLNSTTWKAGIRQILSKHPEFVKTRNTEGKGHKWSYVPSEELIKMEEDTTTVFTRQKENLSSVWEVLNRPNITQNKDKKEEMRFDEHFMDELFR